MKLDFQDAFAPILNAADDLGGGRDVDPVAVECPEVVTHGDTRVLFGPGLDDFNEFDDPC